MIKAEWEKGSLLGLGRFESVVLQIGLHIH